jgi:hypothetical protein
MKTKIFFLIICNLLICNLLFSQNITNTLGTSGLFTIKDGSNNYLTLSQSTGQVNILKTLRLENTTNSSIGVIFKGADRFLHNYGTENTFVGKNSGNFTMTGGYNSAFGVGSLSSISWGTYNSAFGSGSLLSNSSGTYNSAFGSSSLLSNSSGYENSAFGEGSLYSNTTGNNNSAFGSSSLFSNSEGYENSAFGWLSLYSNTSGNNNSAFGIKSLNYNSTGYQNSAMGTNSLYYNSTGYSNSAFGYASLYNNDANYNSAFGYGSGTGILTGSNNTTIGYDAQVPSGINSNQVRIGNTSVTYAGIQVAWTITSDRKWKENIITSPLGLKFITKLDPVSYTRKNDESKKTEYGLIAQEVEEVLKEEGVDNSAMITVTDKGDYELRYNDLLAPMVKAIQELKAENDALKKRIEILEENDIKVSEK